MPDVSFFKFSLLIFACVFTIGEASNYRIVSGRKVSTVEFPYQAQLESLDHHLCGGSIIDEYFILTAAHCVKSMEKLSPIPENILRIRVGNDIAGVGGETYTIEKVIPHEEYSDDAVDDHHDIALVKLENPIVFGPKVKPIKLSTKGPKNGELGWVSGFGHTEVQRRTESGDRPLLAVRLPVVSLSRCRKMLSGVSDDMFCAGFSSGHRDSCKGDSGGPFVLNHRLTGVVAWGLGCGREGVPGVYTNVARYWYWVKLRMEENKN